MGITTLVRPYHEQHMHTTGGCRQAGGANLRNPAEQGMGRWGESSGRDSEFTGLWCPGQPQSYTGFHWGRHRPGGFKGM